MSHPQLTTFLAGIDLFAGLPEDVISDLVQAGSVIHTPAGHVVVRQGDAEAGLRVVLEGSAVIDVDGSRRPGELGPGDYFGEISLIDGRGRSATVTAGERGLDSFAVSPISFWPLLDRHDSLRRTLLAALGARIRALDVEASAVC